MLFTDTDSFTYEIKSKDFYEEFFKHKHLFDVAIFQKTLFYDNQNKMVVVKMNIEHKGIPINKFVGLKSKINSMLSNDGKESNTAKEVNIATE